MKHKIKSLFSKKDQTAAKDITLGKIKGSFFKRESLTEAQLNHHIHIVGASGYGKTVLLSHIIKQRIESGKGLLFIDLKADIETLNKYKEFAKLSNRLDDLQIFSLTDLSISSKYNLIADGTATQLRDRIIQSLNWSEEYYKNQSGSFLLRLLTVLCWLRDHQGFVFSLETILNCCNDPNKIVTFGNKLPTTQTKLRSLSQSLLDFLKEKDSFNSLSGLRAQLESIVLSDFGELVTGSQEGINLFKAYTSSKIILLFLDSRRYSETARSIGRFILEDLKSASAKVDAEVLKADRKPFSVIIDEFADLASEDFIGFLDRARSSKMSVVVAHQEICDLQRISTEFAGRLMGNTSTLYSFLQKRPESAELISAMAGTKKVWKETLRSEKMLFFDFPTGDKSLREVEEFNIHPNTIKSLTVGKCVCIKKYPESKSYVVDVYSDC